MATKKFEASNSSDFIVGNQLRLWRNYFGKKQTELEQLAGLAHNAVSRIEKGEVSPKLETLERLAGALQISVEELQFRIPPSRAKETRDDSLEGLISRLESLPVEQRKKMVVAVNSLIDLMESND
jgi:transcriptional regulator with XRE-family HTH domain